MRGSPLMMFSLGVVVGAAWARKQPAPAAKRAPAPRPPTQAFELPRPGGERASVLGYERAAPATPDPAAGQTSGAPGHRILNG